MSQHTPPHNQAVSQQSSDTNQSSLLHTDWYALRLLNLFRLFLLVMFAAALYIPDTFEVLGSRSPAVFKYTLLLWSALALCFYCTMRLQRPILELQLYLQVYFDIICLVTLMYASGGVQSNLGVLLLVQIAIIANFVRPRFVVLFAAIATAITFSAELFAQLTDNKVAHLTESAMLGASLFAVAIVTTILVNRQTQKHLDTETQRLSTNELRVLREKIIEEIDSGVLHIDNQDNVQLINSQANRLLDSRSQSLPQHLAMFSPVLWQSLQQWRANPNAAVSAIEDTSLSVNILPHYLPLNEEGLLIRIDDNTEITRHLQELKQVSLGRMTSSIAHEIRNPLGAIVNAVQLLEESNNLNESDKNLLQIAQKHSKRINKIIEEVMQFSRSSDTHRESVVVGDFLADFQQRFVLQNNISDDQLQINSLHHIECHFDLNHLDQILWNICSNALIHNDKQTTKIIIHSYHNNEGHSLLDICDNGGGIKKEGREFLFEPFYTTDSGTGLGLYICRELCVSNDASLEYIPVSSGACFRIEMNRSDTHRTAINTGRKAA